MTRPFENFARLSIDEKRQLVSSRFQEIKVKDDQVVSLYLLTGEVVTPRPKEVEDPTTCVGCTRRLRDTEKRYGRERVCARCWDEVWIGERGSAKNSASIGRASTCPVLHPQRF